MGMKTPLFSVASQWYQIWNSETFVLVVYKEWILLTKTYFEKKKKSTENHYSHFSTQQFKPSEAPRCRELQTDS